jgi:hypothetical protein
VGVLENLTKKRISSIIVNKTGRNLIVRECAPVIILNDGMPNLTKHGGDGWYVLTNEGALFVDNYVVLDFEPIKSLTDIGNVIILELRDGTKVGIKPKHETARKVVLSTTISR